MRSGDSGGADCLSGRSTSGAGLSVDSPADVPEVTGIGGTTFSEGSGQYWNATANANGGSAISYIPETVWNDSTTGDPAAGGGGASTVFAQPSWQTGLGVPNNGARNVPDIALSASADHDGYLVYTGGQLPVYGGTSAGTPAFAGITALLNQYLVATGAQAAPGVGNMNPRLYALAQAGTGAFHDVTTGDNIVNVTCGARARNCVPGSYGFPAGQGYDQASGLGSVDAFNLVTAWRSSAGSVTRGVRDRRPAVHGGFRAFQRFPHGHRHRNQLNRRHPHRLRHLQRGRRTDRHRDSLTGTGSSATASITVSAAKLQLGANSIVAQYGGDTALNTATTSINIAVTSAVSGPPVISSLAHGASFGKTYAPGMVLTIFGSNLADANWTASTVPLATQVFGLTVTIGGVNTPFYYVSPGQLNVQIPYETPVNRPVTLTVNNNGRTAHRFPHRRLRRPWSVHRFEGRHRSGKRGRARRHCDSLSHRRRRRLPVDCHRRGPGLRHSCRAVAGTRAVGLRLHRRSHRTHPIHRYPDRLSRCDPSERAIPANTPLGAQPVIVTIGGIPSPPATLLVE